MDQLFGVLRLPSPSTPALYVVTLIAEVPVIIARLWVRTQAIPMPRLGSRSSGIGICKGRVIFRVLTVSPVAVLDISRPLR
jgi:hypothetical protein